MNEACVHVRKYNNSMTVLTKVNTTSFTALNLDIKKRGEGIVKGAELVSSDCNKPLFYLCLSMK